MRIQIIGNYLEKTSQLLSKKGIITESIISALNPLAMAGKGNSDYLHYCDEIDNVPVALNAKKNLAQMLSHDEKNFCSNMQIQPGGTEVRYKNTTDYIVVCNSYIAVNLFEDGDVLYSDIWPQNKMTQDLKANKNLKFIRFPFPEEFDWKYYYDQFIDAVKAEYDAEHIILIKINASQWYMENDSIVKFEPAAKLFKNAVEKIDDYFENKTGCYTVNTLFSQIPDQKIKNAFPYEVFASYIHERIADEIYNIVSGKTKRDALPECHNSYISKRLSCGISDGQKNKLVVLKEDQNNFFDEYQKSEDFQEIKRLEFFLDPDKNNYLSDYLNTLEELTDSQIKEKISTTALYVKYFKVDLNDLIAVYQFYLTCPNKKDFKEIVLNLLEKNDFGPIKTCFDFFERNLNYLRDYKFISEELLKIKINDIAYVKINDSNYIVLDANSEEPMRQIKIEPEQINCQKISDNGYTCIIKQASQICSSWELYIDKARKGDGTKPFKIVFSSNNEFIESLYWMNYTELLHNEHFVLTTDRDCSFDSAYAKTNLEFLLKPNVKIFIITNGLADQLAYYIFAEVLKEKTNSDVYFCDRSFSFNGNEFEKFAKRDISKKIISNLISEKLLEATRWTPWDFANTLFDNGLKELTMVYGGFCASHANKVKCHRIVINHIPSFYTTELNTISVYWCFIRPDEIMEYFPIKMSDYISFPDFDTDINMEISQKMLQSDSISIHVRRGDFVRVGRADDLDFYRDSVEKILTISEYSNKKWFIFSDDIAFCKNHISDLGLDLIKNDEIIFIDHNKYENSFRDMQLMTYSKVIVGGNSGFSRLAALYSERCEVFIYNVKSVMELRKRIGINNKYYVEPYLPAQKPTEDKSSNTANPTNSSAQKTEAAKAQIIQSFSNTNLLRHINRIASIGGSVFDYFIDKGVKQVNLFGNDELIALLYEQAILKGLQVNKCFSDKELEYNINMLDKHLQVGDKDTIAPRQIKTITANTDDNNIPTVILERTSKRFSHAYTIESLLNYSSLMQRLFRTVFEYKKHHAPKLKVVVVQFPTLKNVQNKNEYEISLFQNTNTVDPFKQSGYDDEFINDVVSWLFPEYYKGDFPMLVDCVSKNLNVVGGHRVTVGIPENAAHTIFAFGPSVVFGHKTDDKHTIASCIQRGLNQYYNEKSPYQMLNCAFAGGQNYIAMRKSFLAHQPQNGDVAVFFHWPDVSLLKDVYGDEFYYFDPQKEHHVFDRPHDYGEYMFADSVHLMPAGYDWLGKTVTRDLIDAGVLKEEALTETADREIIVNNKNDEPLPEPLLEYLNSINKSKAVIGAIVMNCNPFTLGHRYLIEYASKKCDKLYVFAVEEDLSFFPFADRIELIRKGTADLDNVTVLPSGNFIISRTTFPAYFEKEATTEDAVIDASSDIEIFAKHIAPSLNICIRFAGEEPLDNVTRQYNAQMKIMLPKYGIDFEVIPRKEINGEVVSASRVRKLLKEGCFDEIEKIVPDTTLEYLKNKFGN